MKISQVAENGRTATPTIRSATASETINKLVTDLNFDEQKTAAITRQLPTTTITSMAAKILREASMLGSPHVTPSKSAAQALSFSVSRMTVLNTLYFTNEDSTIGAFGSLDPIEFFTLELQKMTLSINTHFQLS